ncbi:hypothetical protein [Paenarthrobacter sp. YIM B13468]|uniref:hypothetical protein n=1 Tax=Paenarthrobacter TaxID=1742992 RepID=UPI00366A6318
MQRGSFWPVPGVAMAEAWTVKLFEQPVQWNVDDGVLTLSNSHATIELKES